MEYVIVLMCSCVICLLFNIKYFVEKEEWDKWCEKWKIRK